MDEYEELTAVVALPAEYLAADDRAEQLARAEAQAREVMLERCTDAGRMMLGDVRCEVDACGIIADASGKVLVSAFQDDCVLLRYSVNTVAL